MKPHRNHAYSENISAYTDIPNASSARPAQLAELPRSEFDPELFPHSAYVKFFVTFATKVPYLTFCDKMRQFLI